MITFLGGHRLFYLCYCLCRLLAATVIGVGCQSVLRSGGSNVGGKCSVRAFDPLGSCAYYEWTLFDNHRSMQKKILLLVAIAVALGALMYFNQKGSESGILPTSTVTTYEACVAAGYPVQESYPERCVTPDGLTFTRDIGNELEQSDKIRLSTPRPGETITSPLELVGEARGPWYFEASFPARLLDANGLELAVVPIQATADWMTSEFVPFAGTMEFVSPATATGTLVLQKDNPSGLPEHDDELRVPIVFGAPTPDSSKQTIVQVFFGNSDMGAECEAVVPVDRDVAAVPAIGRVALLELLAGPTAQERAQDYSTALNTGVQINSLTITDGVARVDFDAAFNAGVAGSCRVQAIRAQVEATLQQFPSVDSVIISVDGQTEGILEP